jgi:hypothetical protein
MFGGCFLKSSSSSGLGNIDDAVVAERSDSVKRMQMQYANPSTTIPGHGTIADDPVFRTLALLAKT